MLITALLAVALAKFAIGHGSYGWSLFVGVPYFVGFFSSAVLSFWGPRSLSSCLRIAATASGVLALGFLLFGIEGLICVILAVPLGMPVALFGAWMAYIILESKFAPPAAVATLVVVASNLALWAETKVRRIPPVYTVADSITISASPERVWNSLITMGPLGQPHDLLFRTGVACPQRVDIYGSGVGAMRVCTLTTGQLHEQITAWEPGHLLRWTSITTPPPMKELNPFVDVDPPHLHGFYQSVGGQFELKTLPSGETLVTRSSSYQHGLFPAEYWRLWTDYVARRGHVHVLGVLKQSAEISATAIYRPDE